MHPLSGALPLPWCFGCSTTKELLQRLLAVEVLSTIEPLCSSHCLFGNDVGDSIFDGVGLAGLKSGANAFLLA